MVLGIYTSIANPTNILLSDFYLMTSNRTAGGVHQHFFRRSGNPTKVMRAQRVQITWQGLSETEFTALQTAHLTALYGYVNLEADGLGITTGGTADKALVTLDFQNPNLTRTMSQGWTETGEGPILYDVQGSYIAQVQLETEP